MSEFPEFLLHPILLNLLTPACPIHLATFSFPIPGAGTPWSWGNSKDPGLIGIWLYPFQSPKPVVNCERFGFFHLSSGQLATHPPL